MKSKIQEKWKPFYQKFVVRKTILSQRLQNGEKQMSQLLAKNIKLNAKHLKKLNVVETGLFVSCENPISGALPDGIVSCGCHESGFLEIKCPWTHRDKSVIDYAKLEESCSEIIDNVIVLKKSHRCKCSWQLQGIPGVIFFYVRQKTPFSRKCILIKHFG